MKPLIALFAAIMLTASHSPAESSPTTPRQPASVGATGQNAKNFNTDISDEEDPAEFAQDIQEMGIDDKQVGYAPNQNSPLSVLIDKPSQTITISLDGRVVLQDRVSTGGTMKSPNNPRNPKPPRCANTPEFNKYIPAGSDTMFPVWRSNTYVNSATHEPVPMPFAIRIEGGFFLHEVPPSAVHYLGYAVSGGCIRLPSKVARTLYAMMKQYGGIHLIVQGPNPSAANNPPPYNHICKRNASGIAIKVPVRGGAIMLPRPTVVRPPLDIRPRAAASGFLSES